QKEVGAVQVDGNAERALRRADARHVIDVRVRQQNVPDRQLAAFGKGEQPVDLIARIDEHRLTRDLTADDEAILEERADCLRLDYHSLTLQRGPTPRCLCLRGSRRLALVRGELSAQ